MVEIKLTAHAGSAFDQLQVRLSAADLVLFEQTLDINLDPVRDENGYALTGGSCSWLAAAHKPPYGSFMVFWLASSLFVLTTRRRLRARN